MSLKRNIIANYVGQSWATLLNFLLVPFYIKYMGPEAYGLIGVFTSLQVWIALLDMGIWATVSREMAKFNSGQTRAETIREIFHSTEVIYLFISILIGIILFFLCPFLGSEWLNAEKLPPDVVSTSLQFLALSLVFKWASNLYRGSIHGLQRQVWLNAFSVVTSSVRGFGAIFLLAAFHIEVTSFFKWQCLLTGVEFLGLFIKVHRTLPKSSVKNKFSLESLKPIWVFAKDTFLMNFFSVTMTQTDKLLLSKLLSLEDFGYYSLAASLGTALQIFATPIRNALYPSLVGKIAPAEESHFISTYRAGTQTIALTVVPAAILMIFFSKLAIFVWAGDPVIAEKTFIVASLISFGYMLNAIVQIPAAATLAYGYTKPGVYTNFFSCIVIIPITIFGAIRFGPIGAASGWVILNIGYLFINLHFLHQKYIRSEKWHWYLRSVFVPIAAASLIAALLKPFLPDLNFGRIPLGIFLMITWGLIVTGVALTLPEIRKRVKKLFQSVLKYR